MHLLIITWCLCSSSLFSLFASHRILIGSFQNDPRLIIGQSIFIRSSLICTFTNRCKLNLICGRHNATQYNLNKTFAKFEAGKRYNKTVSCNNRVRCLASHRITGHARNRCNLKFAQLCSKWQHQVKITWTNRTESCANFSQTPCDYTKRLSENFLAFNSSVVLLTLDRELTEKKMSSTKRFLMEKNYEFQWSSPFERLRVEIRVQLKCQLSDTQRWSFDRCYASIHRLLREVKLDSIKMVDFLIGDTNLRQNKEKVWQN